MLLPMGKTMLYFFEICWLNSYPAGLAVHCFPFLWLGCWQVLDDFQYIPSKYWYFGQMTPSEFNKLPIRFSIKVFSLYYLYVNLMIWCDLQLIILSLSVNTNQWFDTATIIIICTHFLKYGIKLKRKVMKIYVP